MQEGCLEGDVLQFGYPILTISVRQRLSEQLDGLLAGRRNE